MIIAVDFDGTLCFDEWPGIGAPNNALIKFLKERKLRGDQLILWTCRSGKELEEAEQKRARLRQDLDSAKSKKFQLESDLSKEKNRCNKLKSKLDRLKTAFSRVESDMGAYVAATKKFESSSSDTMHSNLSSVDVCISSIEEYLATSL